MVVSKIFLAECWTFAAVSVGEDVAALEAVFGVWFVGVIGLWHVAPPPPGFCGKVRSRLDLAADLK